jgi:hypothetical protein
VWKSSFGRPTPSTRCCLRSCVCSMAWRFTEVHAQDNLTHWLIFTQVARAHEILSDPKKREEWDAGAEVVDRPQEFPLKDELIAYYWPELKPFQPFGDVHEHRRAFEKQDAERRAKEDSFARAKRRDAPAAKPEQPPARKGWGWPWS